MYTRGWNVRLSHRIITSKTVMVLITTRWFITCSDPSEICDVTPVQCRSFRHKLIEISQSRARVVYTSQLCPIPMQSVTNTDTCLLQPKLLECNSNNCSSSLLIITSDPSCVVPLARNALTPLQCFPTDSSQPHNPHIAWRLPRVLSWAYFWVSPPLETCMNLYCAPNLTYPTVRASN